MILSMTGYGEAQLSRDGVSYALEFRSLNNRYFKATIKLPEFLSVFEPDVEKLIRTRLTRGSVTYTLRVRNTNADAAQEINVAALQSYLAQLGCVAPSDQVRIDLAAIVALPGVCQPPEMSERDRKTQWSLIETLTCNAIDHLIEMRKNEGRALHDDLLAQCEHIRRNLAAIATRAPEVRTEYHQRLLQRANELLTGAKLQLQSEDVAREVALYAERCDINEELSRITSHLDQFARLCNAENSAGRKLDFLAQELLREANTIGSKANDATIAHHVVEIKGAIDRLKEQVQNIE